MKHCRVAAVLIHVDVLHGINKQVLPMTCEACHARINAGAARRLANLIRRLSSDHDGEIIASVGAIRRTLASAGHTLHNLAELIEASTATAKCEPADWQIVVNALLRQRDQLTGWELRFVRTVSRFRNPPSAKQLDVIADIWRRLEEEAADAA